MAKHKDVLKRFGEPEVRKEQVYPQEKIAYACELDRTYVGGVERGDGNGRRFTQ